MRKWTGLVLLLAALLPLTARAEVQLHGFIQSVTTLAENNDGPAFGFDRVRIRTKGSLNEWVDYDLHLDFNRLILGAGANQVDKDGDTPALIKDAALGFKLPGGHRFFTGKFKTPVGREFNTAGFKLDFVKRGFGQQTLVFERNTGVMFQSRPLGSMKTELRAGIFNPGPNKATDTGDPAQGVDLTLAGWLKLKPAQGLTLWAYGGAVSTSDTTTAGLDQEGISVMGGSALFKKGAFTFGADWLDRDDPDHAGSDGSNLMAHALWQAKPWLQPAIKYESLDVSDDGKDRADLTLGVNFFLPVKNTWESKIMVNYVSSDMDGASALQIMFQGYF